MPMPTSLVGLARSARIRALHTDDHAACLALRRQCDGVAVRIWEDASAMTRLIERNPALSCAAEVVGRLVGRLLCGHDGRRGWVYPVAVATARPCHGAGQPGAGRTGEGRHPPGACTDALREPRRDAVLVCCRLAPA